MSTDASRGPCGSSCCWSRSSASTSCFSGRAVSRCWPIRAGPCSGLGVGVLLLPLVGIADRRPGAPFRPRRAATRGAARRRRTDRRRHPRGPAGGTSPPLMPSSPNAGRRSRLQPEGWRAWYRLGVAYGDAGDVARGRRAVRRAIALERRPRGSRRRGERVGLGIGSRRFALGLVAVALAALVLRVVYVLGWHYPAGSAGTRTTTTTPPTCSRRARVSPTPSACCRTT